MKIIVKTLNGKQLPLDVESDWTVRRLKEQMESVHDLKADTLKLIAYGKVLDKDENAISTYQIKEGDFIVAMVQKAKPAKAAPKAPVEDAKQEEPVAATTAAATNPPAQAQPVAASTAPATNPPAQAQPAQPQPAIELTPQVEAAINELMAISGQPKELCVKALTAAQGIPDVAFEFLLSGQIPDVPLGGGLEDAYGDEEMGEDVEGLEEGSGAGVAGLGQYNLDPSTLQAIQALVSNPSFELIRQRMAQDPTFSQNFMQQLQQTQPAIFNAIQQNPAILMSLILGHDPMQGGAMAGGAGAGGQPGAMGGMGQQQPQPGQIQVSATELESINRLSQLGFAKSRAAEAFFACDKNEEMAANFLFEAGAEDEDTATLNAIAASQQQMVGGDANPGAEAQAEPVPADNQNAAAQENQPEGGEGGQEQQNQDQQNNDNKPEDQNNNNNEGGAGAGDGGGSSLI